MTNIMAVHVKLSFRGMSENTLRAFATFQHLEYMSMIKAFPRKTSFLTLFLSIQVFIHSSNKAYSKVTEGETTLFFSICPQKEYIWIWIKAFRTKNIRTKPKFNHMRMQLSTVDLFE
ncbi:hypothetical protein V6N12_063868 [Hibiscus sabdariffa]|uniref:Uncharacterized protein n=1 Tax=Hibiscus sabdariffa TaxID=183260 RepID=A0ABR2AQX0_9ROSI